MIYDSWMSFIKDDAKITKTAMPGAHNAGSFGMWSMARCQDGTLFEQFEHGVRHFCIRLDTLKNGKIVLAHGVSKGVAFEDVLSDMRRMLEKNDSEIFIFDIREYYPQRFGPLTLRYKADPKEVDRLLKKYIDPEKYALSSFSDISAVTLGEFRKNKKRYMIVNPKEDYAFSVKANLIMPWVPEIFGLKPSAFANETLRLFDENSTDGFYWFQTQLTPNPGTEMGLRTPRTLDKMMKPYFPYLINSIKDCPERLEKVNIVGSDFMTDGFEKSKMIIGLNLDKGLVKKAHIKMFEEEFGGCG